VGDSAGDGLGVVALNVQHAARDRLERQVAWLASIDCADILVLSEVGGGDRCRHLLHLLEAAGYLAVHSDNIEAAFLVVIAFRHCAITEPPSALQHCPRLVRTFARTRGGELEIVGLYVPSRGPTGQRNVAKRAFQNEVTHMLPAIVDSARRAGRELIIAGDLNVVEPGHIPHHRVFGTWEHEFYTAFLTVGRLSDAFRTMNGAEVDHSWFGQRSGLGYRIDHLFVSAGLGVDECSYDHGPRLAGLSDHAALCAHLHFRSREGRRGGQGPMALP